MSLDKLRPEEQENVESDRNLILLEEISQKLSTIIKYWAKFQKADLEEDL